MKNRAPFRHSDGSNCWTKNCSRGNQSTGVSVVQGQARPLQYGSSEYIRFREQADALESRVTVQEQQAVMEYTGWAYSHFREYLHGADENGTPFAAHVEDPVKKEAIMGAMSRRVERVDAVVQKAGKFPPMTVTRGVRLPAGVSWDDVVERDFQEGATFSDKSFMSTTLEPTIASQTLGKNPGYLLVFETDEGAALGDGLSEQGLREREILIPRGKQFRVKKVGVASVGKEKHHAVWLVPA